MNVDDPDDLVTVYEAENVTDAYFVKNLLGDEGIEATVAGGHEPFAMNITAPEVLVRRRDEARARTLVDEYDAQQERRALRADWTCPSCAATVPGAFDECDRCAAPRAEA